MSEERKLYPEDQARVDSYLREGYNETERRPFRPWRLMLMLTVIVMAFTYLSIWIARWAGVY